VIRRRDRRIDWGVSVDGRIVELWRESWRYVVKVYLEVHSVVDPTASQWVCVVHTFQTITTARITYAQFMLGDVDEIERRMHPSAGDDGLSFIWDEAPEEGER